MKIRIVAFVVSAVLPVGVLAETVATDVTDLGTIVVEGTVLSKYRPETVNGATFTDLPPEKVPTVVDTLTQDFIEERNPTDVYDLIRYVPGVSTGGNSLMVRQPGCFSIRGKGGTEPSFDGVFSIGSGAGLFMNAFLLDRVEIVKGPIGSLGGGQGSTDPNGGGGSINLYLKSAYLDRDETALQATSSIGKHVQRHRGMVDHNETFLDGKGAVRVIGAADYYEPVYIHQGSQKGARPRESFSLAPSFIFAPTDEMQFGLKTMFQYTDQPSYIGVPVYRGRPRPDYTWYESSCLPGNRSHYEGFLINPWVDWQVTEDWLLKFGAAMMVSSWNQQTQEPTSGDYYTRPGGYPKPDEPKYIWTEFGNYRKSLSRSYNLYARSVYDKELGLGFKNNFLVQPDLYYRETSHAATTTRYGITLQDTLSWGWVTLLGGVRYDYFDAQHYLTSAGKYKAHQGAHAVSPRGGLTIQPLDWLVVFGNLSQTQTPQLGLETADHISKTKPWIATQYEAGVRVRPVEGLWASLSAFRIEQENTPIRQGNSDVIIGQEGANTSRGVEFSLTGDITENWTVMAMYAFQNYTDRTKPAGSKARDFERNPAHTISVNTSYRFSSGPLADIVVGGAYRFRSMSYATVRGEYKDENLYFNPSHVVDVNLAIPLSKFGGSQNWTLTLACRNLFGEKYFETSRHYYECFAGEPRTFEIGVRAKF